MEEIYKVMQKTIGEDLEHMQQDVVRKWPEEDAELLLLHWLCEKKGIKQPMPTKKGEPQDDMFGTSRARRKSKLLFDANKFAGLLEDRPEGKLKTSLPSPRVKLTDENMLIERLAHERDYSRVTTSGVAGYLVEDDAWRFEESLECIKQQDAHVAGTIANLRTQLRGKFLSRVPLLTTAVLTDMDRYWLVGKLRPYNFKEGEHVVTEGEMGDTLYIIESGFCEVVAGGKTRVVIGREDFFGELAMLYASPRTATVRAKTDVTCLSLARNDFNSTLSEEKVEALKIVARTRLFTDIPLLCALSPTQKEMVTSCLKQESWPKGAVLARQGNKVGGKARRMYIILDGFCLKEVLSTSFHEEEVGVESLRHGQYFNMFAMWYGCDCGATITTTTDVTTLSLSFDELMEICTREVEEARKLEAELKALEIPENMSVLTDMEAPIVSETLASIRNAMWMHLLRGFFFKMKLEKVAENVDALSLICDYSHEVSFKTWDAVFTKGVAFDAVYILETGTLSEHKHDVDTLRDADVVDDSSGCLQHICPGTSFGEKCLQGKDQNVPLSTLCASCECTMLCLPGDVLRRMLRTTLE